MQINLRIKETVSDLTKQLFYALFDDNSKQKEQLKYLEPIFKTVVKEITDKQPDNIWNAFESKLPEIKSKIELDAIATEKNDPACKSYKKSI